MIGLVFELLEWMIKLTIVLMYAVIRTIVAAYHATDRLVHEHRISRNPHASREASQLIAGTTVAAVLGVLALIGTAAGGSSGSSEGTAPAAAAAAPATAMPHARIATRLKISRGHRKAQAARSVARHRSRPVAHRPTARVVAHESRAASHCNPNYGGCLKPDATDYDCSGGSGDGPEYTGPVAVKGYDEYGLDRDGDGTGCNDS